MMSMRETGQEAKDKQRWKRVEIAHLVKYLPCKHKDLSSIPTTSLKSQVWWWLSVTPILRTQKEVNPWCFLTCQPSLIVEPQVSVRDTKWKAPEEPEADL